MLKSRVVSICSCAVYVSCLGNGGRRAAERQVSVGLVVNLIDSLGSMCAGEQNEFTGDLS